MIFLSINLLITEILNEETRITNGIFDLKVNYIITICLMILFSSKHLNI